jgi:hypothetical protein
MNSLLLPSFHPYYKEQLNQLPYSIKNSIWQRLITRKRPLTIEQASSIHPEVEKLLNHEVNNYIKKKSRQRSNRQSARNNEITTCFINKLKERIRTLEDIVSDKNKTINTTYELFYNSVMQDT